MNREQAKQLLPIIKAYAEGKKIECKQLNGSWDEMIDPVFNAKAERYRIAPEPKYRPFKDDEECWNEMQNHQPFGWIKSEHEYYQVIGVRDNNDVCFSITGDFWKFGYVFDSYTFADGTPFGIKEEK